MRIKVHDRTFFFLWGDVCFLWYNGSSGSGHFRYRTLFGFRFNRLVCRDFCNSCITYTFNDENFKVGLYQHVCALQKGIS